MGVTNPTLGEFFRPYVVWDHERLIQFQGILKCLKSSSGRKKLCFEGLFCRTFCGGKTCLRLTP
jgi:hypothetical protein